MRRYKFLSLGLIALASSSFQSCVTPKDVTYFQDMNQGTTIEVAPASDVKVMPDDRLSIIVSSKDPTLASLFNLYAPTVRAGNTTVTTPGGGGGGSNAVASYVVDAFGDIQFPILGTLHIGGMKRTQVSEYIQDELKKRNLVKDPIVNVDFLNHTVTVLGSVNSPGLITFDKDRYTILEAIADAGDLTLQGERTNIKVLRNEDGRETAYIVDLTDAKDVMQSPVYYLQQNDIIYVTPTDTQKRQRTANGNSPLTPSFWISLASLASTIALLIIK